MILKSIVFAMLMCISSQEKTFASDLEFQALPQDSGKVVEKKLREEPAKKVKKTSWWSCCSRKQVLDAVEEAGRVVGEVAPVAIFEFGSAILEDLADDGKVNGSVKSAYAKAVADTIRAFHLKGKASVIVDASAGLADMTAQDLKDGKLNESHSTYIKVLFREIERSHPEAADHEKEATILSSFILNLVDDLSDGKFDASDTDHYIRDFNALMDILAEKAQDKPLLLQGLESAKTAFPDVLTLDRRVNMKESIQIIQKALKPFHIANPTSIEERRQDLALAVIDVVLKDSQDGHLDGTVNGTSQEYIKLAIDTATLTQYSTNKTKGDK